MQDLVSMDLSQERKMVTRKESGQAVGCHDHHQPAGIVTEEATERVNIIIHQKGSSSSSPTMKEKHASLKNALNETTQSPIPLIQRVPYMLRDRDHKNFDKYYEPRVVTIGPLHHGRSPNLQPAEQLKRRLAALFVKDTGLDSEILYDKIWTEIRSLRERFDPEETKSFTDEQLAWMLFVDGCAVLHFIKYTINEKMKELKIKVNQIAFIRQDLFLLENQIPFRVLELLTSSESNSKQKKDWEDVIQKFVNIGMKTKGEEKILNPFHHLHLLHLLHANLVLNPPLNSKPNEDGSFIFRRAEHRGWHIFRNNVKDLKSAGIILKCSPTSFLTDIKFTSWWCFGGKLILPDIHVDDSTGPKFMNLIAYEMCPDYDNDFTVTSYVCFIDTLVDQSDHVFELRKARILLNYLGSDEEVAKLFNEISTDLVPNPDTYNHVKEKIDKHCEYKWNTWMAQAYHDHFSSPCGKPKQNSQIYIATIISHLIHIFSVSTICRGEEEYIEEEEGRDH